MYLHVMRAHSTIHQVGMKSKHKFSSIIFLISHNASWIYPYNFLHLRISAKQTVTLNWAPGSFLIPQYLHKNDVGGVVYCLTHTKAQLNPVNSQVSCHLKSLGYGYCAFQNLLKCLRLMMYIIYPELQSYSKLAIQLLSVVILSKGRGLFLFMIMPSLYGIGFLCFNVIYWRMYCFLLWVFYWLVLGYTYFYSVQYCWYPRYPSLQFIHSLAAGNHGCSQRDHSDSSPNP